MLLQPRPEHGDVPTIVGRVVPFRRPAHCRIGMNSAAAIRPPTDLVYARIWFACVGVQTPAGLRVPALVANEVTSSAFTACAKSMTPFHSFRVSTPLNPAGAFWGGVFESAK